jgi:endoglucanase
MKPMMRRREFLFSSARYLGVSAVYSALPSALTRAKAAPLETTTGSAVALNQVGYLPARSKRASVDVRAASFAIRSVTGNDVAYRGQLSPPAADAASGDTLQTADFSALTAPGSYVLELDSGQKSPAFRVAGDVYSDALRLTTRAFYGQRCGCRVDLGGGYVHSVCHLSAAYHPSSGKSGALQNRGGWHDAGDYGRYIVNSGISTGTLLWAWELYQRSLSKLALQIPESGGKLPDFLAEIRWNLDWMLTPAILPLHHAAG